MIRRRWSAEEADGWGREDWIAIVLSPLVYFLLTLGTALALLLRWQGAVLLVVGIVLAEVMHRVIDPKLTAISEDLHWSPSNERPKTTSTSSRPTWRIWR